jgi:hypothetical protein
MKKSSSTTAAIIVLAYVIFILSLALTGCTSVTYTDKEGRSVKSSSLFTDKGPTKIVYVESAGEKRAEIDIGQRSQVETLTKLKELAEAIK